MCIQLYSSRRGPYCLVIHTPKANPWAEPHPQAGLRAGAPRTLVGYVSPCDLDLLGSWPDLDAHDGPEAVGERLGLVHSGGWFSGRDVDAIAHALNVRAHCRRRQAGKRGKVDGRQRQAEQGAQEAAAAADERPHSV